MSKANAGNVIIDWNKLDGRISVAEKRIMGSKTSLMRFALEYFRYTGDGQPHVMSKNITLRDERGRVVKKNGVGVQKVVMVDPAWYHPVLCNKLQSGDNCLFMLFRGGAKTVYTMRIDPLWHIFRDPFGVGPFEELHVTNPINVSRNLRFIERELKTNKLLLHDYGKKDIVKATFGDTSELGLSNGYRLFGRTYHSGVRGVSETQRPWRLKLDDMLERKLIKTVDLRQKTKEFIWKDAWRTVQPGGQKIFTGTPIHPMDEISVQYDSALKEMGKPNCTWPQVMRVPAEFFASVDGKLTRVSNWPQYWSIEELDAEREKMERELPGSYDQEMRLIAVVSVNHIFSGDIMPKWRVLPPPSECIFSIGVDLDDGKGQEDGSQTAIVTWAGLLRDISYQGEDGFVQTAGHLFHVKSSADFYTTDDRVEEFIRHWNATSRRAEVFVEDKAGAESFKRDVLRRCNELGIRPPVIQLSKPGTRDKKIRAESITYLWHRGRVWHHPADDITDSQFVNFQGLSKGEMNDIVDASYYAIDGAFAGKEGPGMENWFERYKQPAKARVCEPALDIDDSGAIHKSYPVETERDTIQMRQGT